MHNAPAEAEQQEETTNLFHVRPSVTCTRTEHEFRRTSGTTVQCITCPVGYIVGPDTMIDETGKLLIKGHKVT